ncbi:MAG: fatty acyl-AMP ligase, partial [Planctomycetes bacterium]|nr:fatty acyl-AMP ligase [Planctomycetota bacterium]
MCNHAVGACTVNIDRHLAPYSPPTTSFADVLSYWTEHQPEVVAYYFSDGDVQYAQITYRELMSASLGIARELLRRGLRGERALLMFHPGLDFMKAFLGCLYAGVVAVPAFTPRRNRNVARLQAISENAEARVALTMADVR